ncbi:MAG: hypothetical protein QF829_00325 [Candidatus Hydrothermarchaeota archaeon]|jgi:hypothetical protein|nr:hypothetical protein [Candidatus Hydrothermarchaeota archaeon]|tara:strand:+ start:131 stop:304 length:174 start_codon:yes stop_codon:yes gene_type:complete
MASYWVHKTHNYQILSGKGESSVREYMLLSVDGAGFVVLEQDLSVKDEKEDKDEKIW